MKRVALTGFLISCGILTTIQAGTITWTGGAETSNWTDGANWDSTYAPGPSADVVIALDGTSVILPYGTPITIASLTLGGGSGEGTETLQNPGYLNTAGSWLTATGDVTIASDGVLNLRGAAQGGSIYGDSLTAGGTITNAGTMTVSNYSIVTGNVVNTGLLSVSKYDATINGDLTNAAGGQLDLKAGVDYLNATLYVYGNLSNAGRFDIFSQQYSTYPTYWVNAKLYVYDGAFTNTGTVVDSSDNYYNSYHAIFIADFDNQGVLLVKGYKSLGFSNTATSSTVTNSGHMRVQQSLSFSNLVTFANTGTIAIDTSRTLTLYGYDGAGTYTGSDEQFHGNGILALSDVALDVTAFPPLDSLSLIMSGTSSLTLTDSFIVHRSLTATGSSITANGVRNQGTFSLDGNGSLASPAKDINNNATMVLTGGSVTGTMVNYDSLNVNSGTALSAGLTNTENATLVVTANSPAGLSVDGDLTNHGLMIMKPKTTSSYTLVSVTNGSLINTATGTIQGVTGITGTSTSLMACHLVNEGLFDNHFRIAFRGDSSHTNSGTIQINKAAFASYQVHNSTLSFENGATLTNTGTVFLDDTSRLQISSATYQGEGGTLDGIGTLYLFKGTGHLGQKFVVEDSGVKLLPIASTIYVDSLINQTTWTAWGNTVYADSIIINQDKLVLEPYSSGGYYYNAWHGPFINDDTLIIEPFPQYTQTHISANEILGGPVVNDTGAVLLVQSSTHGTATLTVDSSLTNHGTLTLANDPEATYDYRAYLNVDKGWLTNSSTGVINGLAYSVVKADLDNQGTFNVAPNISLTMDKNPERILNSGAINITAGDYFRIDKLDSLVNTGTITIDAGQLVQLYGLGVYTEFPTPEGLFVIDGDGQMSNGGTVEIKYLTLQPGPKLQLENSENVTLYYSRIETDSLVNEGHLTLTNVSVSGEVVNRDTLILQLHGAAFDSTLVNEAGALIRGEGNYSNGWTDLNVDSSFTNHGELELTTISTTAKGMQVYVQAGGLVNSSTGSINVLVGTSTSTALEHKLYTDLVNQGSLTLDSDAVLTVAGTSFDNESGGVVQGEGTLDVTAVDFTSGGAINPGGSPGIFTIVGDVALEATNVINLELDGDEPGTGYDQLNVTGNAALAGSLKVSIVAPYIPADGRTFQPLIFGSSSGVFESLTTQGEGPFLNAHFTETGVYLTASLTGENNWPFVGGIADITAPEDTALAIVLVAFDPDESDVLTFSASSDTPAVELTLIADTLTITPQLNWNGVANIEVIVSDGSLKDTTDFVLTLTPVQDEPLPFDLIAPATDSTVTITPDNRYTQWLVFSWNVSVDPDGEAVGYDLAFTGDLTQLPARTIYGTDTTVSWSYSEIVTAISGAGMETFSGTWTIEASDPADSTTTAANGPFNLTINANAILGLDGKGLIPEVFALHDNYPNPFNPSTTIRYDLPEAADVSLVVYDMLGREVVRLVDGWLEPGYHQVVWQGHDQRGRPVPSGLYLVLMNSPQYNRTIKVVLLK
jgi:hypothetical protein